MENKASANFVFMENMYPMQSRLQLPLAGRCHAHPQTQLPLVGLRASLVMPFFLIHDRL